MIAVFGANGAIGAALINECLIKYPESPIFAFSRSVYQHPSEKVRSIQLDYFNEEELAKHALLIKERGPLTRCIVATGLLHSDNLQPEKALRQISERNFNELFKVNTILPALIAKYFVPLLNKESKSVFAALSARVGSISDNRLGGWYAYRASKAALNMILKTTSIETSRQNKKAIIVGLHPGTVDSALSKPFQNNVPDSKLFTADFSAKKLIEVLEKIEFNDSGKCFAWDAKEIEA